MSSDTSGINPRFSKKTLHRPDPDTLIKGILKGDITVLSRGITFIESSKEEDQAGKHRIIQALLPYTGQSLRIGITGIPGAGKSTLIEALGLELISQGHKVAVLAVDPSSQLSKGSILGDKTRMEQLSRHPNAYIRPTPSAGTMGGVARHTREAMLLCEAAGFDIILIETVGVGQSETAVHSMTDLFLLLAIPGTGDELQGIKRGIMEMADIIFINKADINPEKVRQTQKQLENALHFFPLHASEQPVQVLTGSAIQKPTVAELCQSILKYAQAIRNSGYFESQRKEQSVWWFKETLDQEILKRFYQQNKNNQMVDHLRQQVSEGKLDPFQAADQVMKAWK
ncbi:MAG: methylmalonyl Co-A mutase-associated GTPase MeaB [Flavobacteriales bacterium]|nr:methylmalonyl Co-A mutase-associated GTPase MeaB [Flavobacteriales bacterium]